MSVDIKCYDLAKVWLSGTGWTCTTDIERLAQRIQNTIEDFEADLANDAEAHHDRPR